MFGRRKSALPKGRAKSNAPKPAPISPKKDPIREPVRPAHVSTHVLPIVVQQEEYDRGGADLVYAVVRYVNLMMEDGRYDATQLPAHAMQSYHTDLYLAQVNNGGHSQFIGNLIGPHFDDTIRNIRQAFQQINSQPYTQIFENFLTWLQRHPKLASRQSGFGDIPAALNEMDTRFYGQSKLNNLSDLNAKWIESWKDIKVVPKASYKAEMQKLFSSNPQRDANERTRAIRTIQYNLIGGPTAKLNYVGFKPGIMVSRMLPGNTQEIEGRDASVFPIDTNKGMLLGVFSDHWTGIYRPVPNDKPRAVHHIMNSEIEKVTALISKHKAPAALHLLMRSWNLKNDVLLMTPNVNIHGQLAVVLTTKTAELFIVAFGDLGARLLDSKKTRITEVSRQAILAHASASL